MLPLSILVAYQCLSVYGRRRLHMTVRVRTVSTGTQTYHYVGERNLLHISNRHETIVRAHASLAVTRTYGVLAVTHMSVYFSRSALN
jgi:hypothetical protein